MTRNDAKLGLLLLFLQRPSVFTDPQSNNRLPPSRLLASITRHPGQWCNLIWKIQLLVLSMKSMGQGLIIVVGIIEIPPPPFKTARLYTIFTCSLQWSRKSRFCSLTARLYKAGFIVGFLFHSSRLLELHFMSLTLSQFLALLHKISIEIDLQCKNMVSSMQPRPDPVHQWVQFALWMGLNSSFLFLFVFMK